MLEHRHAHTNIRTLVAFNRVAVCCCYFSIWLPSTIEMLCDIAKMNEQQWKIHTRTHEKTERERERAVAEDEENERL